jgi:hypothetical protein
MFLQAWQAAARSRVCQPAGQQEWLQARQLRALQGRPQDCSLLLCCSDGLPASLPWLHSVEGMAAARHRRLQRRRHLAACSTWQCGGVVAVCVLQTSLTAIMGKSRHMV